ncbi:caspase family protein [Tenacibaculum sp. M341]|uniref:caspase family protein n=1 Tax=Tenacibaculum sp. M341 TaxID=2530339 RepID=UPI00105116B1|nr:caspase family protein [Tenacibaculum sp. M341]TCI95093.1 caspase family protein [Tenacibaculum sp. M341]
MKRALLVGINDYPTAPLNGCINDAKRMQEVFERHENDDKNFDCKMLISDTKKITRGLLRSSIIKLFNHNDGDTTLLYFSGHGATTDAGTYLVTQDVQSNDLGVSLLEIVALANNSKAKEVIIILDCCHSGGAGNSIDLGERKIILREGVSILAASTETQYSYEKNGGGVFTGIIYDALRGSAADVIGRVTLANLYYFADTLLDAWKQRPVFKSHVSHMISLRNCESKIPNPVLRKLPEYFSEDNSSFSLSENHLHNENLALVTKHLRQYYANGLLTLGTTDSFEAEASKNGVCKLTALGKYYKKIVVENRL